MKLPGGDCDSRAIIALPATMISGCGISAVGNCASATFSSETSVFGMVLTGVVHPTAQLSPEQSLASPVQHPLHWTIPARSSRQNDVAGIQQTPSNIATKTCSLRIASMLRAKTGFVNERLISRANIAFDENCGATPSIIAGQFGQI